MAFTTLIQAAELAGLLQAKADVVVFDCSFDLGRVDAGREAYAAGHVPGAVYLHLDADLSGPKDGRNGRHPLPDRAALRQRLAQAGVGDGTQLVACDGAGGMYASRLWWLARWLGCAHVAVLDGGFPAWQAAGLPVETLTPPERPVASLSPRDSLVGTVERDTVMARLHTPGQLLVDARGADRFCGENETLDPVAGHIPGARNRPFRDNLGADGRFKAAAQLRAEFDALIAGRPVDTLVMQCGSGVTACHNLLALEVAGLPGATLYAGSWSEWCTYPGAPTAVGSD
ncbi:MAG: sulfurtransferase [Rubrivivax sp.]|nr:sulfurtransferase [Rubrivivax sp.]